MWLHADTYDNTTRSKTENCLVSVIALGISCSKKQPKERTLIESAAAKMHTIRDSYLIFYGEGSSISNLGDVYSLGILLLDMFTGSCPADDMFQGTLDLHKLSEDAYPKRIWEIIDSTMWLHKDIHDNTRRSAIQDCLISVVALGISSIVLEETTKRADICA
ncbi:hypothetical protein EJB05_31500, partial [Eragrostis curvula]